MQRFHRVTTIACFLIGLTIPAHGQATGTLLGTVTDASNAAIPDADVSATNEATGVLRKASSGTTGEFLVPRLPAGRYTVRVEKQGFRAFESRAVIVPVDQSVTIPVTMQVGTVNEAVTVSDSVTMLQTNSATLSQVVEQKRVEELPLNGRNVLNLIRLNAGVSSRGAGGYGQFQIAGASYASANSISGTRGNQTGFLLDGGNNTNGIVNGANPSPSPDAVQEFSVQGNNFSAEYGNVAGGIVNVVTRSGTNALHGSIFEFYRDGRMNARSFFASQRDFLKRHQFGVTVGGPIVIPKLYNGRNRTFFFGSYQGTRIREVSNDARLTVFTPAQAAGNFAGMSAIRDPLTNTPFANNVIPVSRFDAVSAALLPNLPTANLTGTNIYAYSPPKAITNDGQYLLRFDHQLTANDSITGRYFHFGYEVPAAALPGNFFFNRTGSDALAKNAQASHTHIFSPRLMNVARFTYNYQRTDTTSLLDISPADYGARIVRGFQGGFVMSVTGFSGINTGTVGRAYNKNYEFSNVLSMSTGKHNLRVGYQFLRDMKYASNNFNASGAYAFSGQRAGHAIADYLLGVPVTLGIRNLAVSDTFANYHGLFFQDDYRVTRRLTLNLGLRWDGTEPYVDRRGFQPYFRPGAVSTVFPRAPRGTLFPGDVGVPAAEGALNARPSDPDRVNFAPRFGFAFNPTARTVVRGAYGIFFGHAPAQITAVASEPWVRSTNINNPTTFSNPFGSDAPVNPNVNEAPSDFVFSAAPAFSVMDPRFVNSMTQTMNFGVERQLTTDLMVRAMYVGTLGQHLEVGRELNYAPYIAGASTTANINARRIYAGIGNLRNTESTGRSWYHSMQLSLTRRFARGFSFQGNYTFSKSIDDTSSYVSPANTIGPDPNNRKLNRGLSDFDTTHRFVASGIYELPKLGQGAAAWAKAIVNGWQANAIVEIESGVPFTPFDSRDLALAGVGSGVRLMQTGDAALDASRPRSALTSRYFNTQVYSLPPEGHFGVSGRNTLRGPGTVNTDFSLFKNFTVREKAKFQFRSEFFNLFNRPNFGNPVATFNSPTFGTIQSSNNGRVVQLGLRITF